MIEVELAYAVLDAYPVTPWHTLIIPKRHVDDYFGLTEEEVSACNELIRQMRVIIISRDDSVT